MMLPVMNLKPLVSQAHPFEDIDQAFEEERNGKVMKALVKP